MRVLFYEGVPFGKASSRPAGRETPGGGQAFPAELATRARAAVGAVRRAREAEPQGARRAKAEQLPSRRCDGGEASARGARAPLQA